MFTYSIIQHRDIAISVEEADAANQKKEEGKVEVAGVREENEDENCDDSESFQASGRGESVKGGGGGGGSANQIGDTLRLKQITKVISPKWSNRVFAVELIRKIIQMCASTSADKEVAVIFC